MNRRDFLKGGLFGAFGAALTWAGGVRAEERPTDSDTADGEIVECDLFPLLAPQNLDDAILRRPTEPDSDLGRLFSQNGQIDWPRTWAALEEIGIPIEPWEGQLKSAKINGHGAVWKDMDAGLGHWIYWTADGSDEDGTGATDDPVSTEACAQSIADLG